MLILGLTGPTGSGKGAIGHFFRERGIPVLDTDEIYHELIGTKTSCTEELIAVFGSEIATAEGSIDRRALAALVLGDSELHSKRRASLNQITHKYVLDECRRRLSVYREEGACAAVIDAPLLYESGFDKECDRVIAVLAPASLRLGRIMRRDGLSEEKALQRMHSQPNDDFYRSRADLVIENVGTEEELSAYVSELFHRFFIK